MPDTRSRPPRGQHFLKDRRAIDSIVDALELEPDQPVIEIGPGRGALTAPLIERVGRIAAVEIDSRLADGLRSRFPDESLALVVGDALRTNFPELAIRLVGRATPVVIAGNLPYGISKPFALKVVRERSAIERAVLMFQTEVAERLTARPGQKAYGPLGILAGRYYRIERLFDLPPRAFSPPPRVRSTVTRWTHHPGVVDSADAFARLMACLETCFRRRRQTLRNNLRVRFAQAETVARLVDAGLDGGTRAEALAPEAFVRLARDWPLV